MNSPMAEWSVVRGLRIAAALSLVVGLAGCAASDVADSGEGIGPSGDALVESEVQAWDSLQQQYPSAERPNVERVRYVSMEEWDDVIVDCLRREGYSQVTVGPTGGVSYEGIADSQMQAFQVAQFSCSVQYPLDPKYAQPLTDEILTRLYEYSVGELAECLEELGYEVSEAPSLRTFIDSYSTDPWSPFGDALMQANQQGADATIQLFDECPEHPIDLWD